MIGRRPINRYNRPSGFSYENYFRNEEMKRMGYEPPMPMTTGTTVVGLQFDGGIIIASDTCAQRQNLITSTATQKLFRLSNNIYCGGSGYFSDVVNVTRVLQMNIELLSKQWRKRPVPVACVKQATKGILMSQLGRLIVSLVLGGVDANGVHLYSVHFDGTSEKCMFTSIGTGQYCAIAILEERWKLDISESDARELIVDAVKSGIKYDTKSACSVDFVIIRSDYTVETHILENYTAETLPEHPCTHPKTRLLPVRVKGEMENEEDNCIYILEEKVTPLKIIIPVPIPEKTERSFNKGLRTSRAVTKFNFNPIIDHHSDDDDGDDDDDDADDDDDDDLPTRKRIKITK